MSKIKIFKVNEDIIIVCTSNNFYDSNAWNRSTNVYLSYSDSFISEREPCVLPRHFIGLFRLGITIEKYIEKINNSFNKAIENNELELQYTDLQDKIKDYNNIAFIRRNLGVYSYSRISDMTFSFSNDSKFDLESFNNNTIKAFNV